MDLNLPATPLVDASWLARNLADSHLRVIDVRWYLSGKRGVDAWVSGHIPGAVFLDLDVDLTARKGPGRHPIPGAGQLERAMRKAGVCTDSFVVVYDDAGGSIAARLWWLLRYYGHPRVAVLDGGIQAWSAAGQRVTTEESPVSEGDFSAGPPDPEWVVDRSHVDEARRRATEVVLFDARAPERYRGETEPVDARAGHIPGARSAPWAANLADGRFRRVDELRAQYSALGADQAREVILYCGSGVTACHDLLALELAGIRGAKLYEGSWSDWARHEDLPIETGSDPRSV